jgi:S1-C subfamily serine protease
LGIYAAEQADHVVVAGLTRGGPAERAGLKLGDIILEAVARRVRTLPELFRTIWASGAAGVEVPLKLSRGDEALHLVVQSATRDDYLKKPLKH